MRLRISALASVPVAAACALVPAVASAAPHPVRNHRLTIHATPGQIIAGDSVLIFGRLQGANVAGRPIVLYHRVNPRDRFTVIGRTHTDAVGRYEFTRAEGIVNSNRSWFVRGPRHSHSATIHEHVAAEVTMTPSADAGTTRTPLTFSGQLTPGHRGGTVALQVRHGDGSSWHTVDQASVAAGSSYTIRHAWRTPGARIVRVAFAGNRRNAAAASDPSAVVIEQAQVPHLTIISSAPIAANGAPVTISGVLKKKGAPVPGAQIGLYAKAPHSGAPFALAQATTSGADGSYAFTVENTQNQLYRTKAIGGSQKPSAVLFQGVQDVVSMNANTTTSTVGGTVTFSGTVAPDKTGHIVDLERLGRDGQWHAVEASAISAGSTFSFSWTFGFPGDHQFRARVLGGPANVGGASAPIPMSVSLPPLAALPMG